MMNVLEVKNLKIRFDTEAGPLTAVDDVSFSLEKGKTLGIVGESGCGKSITALSILRLLPKPSGHVDLGQILYNGQNLLDLPYEEMYKIRGRKISMIFQEPMTALNPVKTIGSQMAEVYQLHFPEMSKEEVKKKSCESLERVGISIPERRLNEFPHQLSGGLRQRVMIAMALACKPDILIADEPTTALDVTIQAQILDLIKSLQKEIGMSVILITHDLGVIAQTCDDVLVMYAGRVAEQTDVKTLFSKSRHPYTHGLISSIPRLDFVPKTKLMTIPGMVPSLMDMPKGCRYQNRCSFAEPKCSESVPTLESVSDDQKVSCFRWKEINWSQKNV
jgi:peptide/nickel transport system ATP-binding protein